MQPKILITGATGFVGAHAALEFINAGYRVIGTYRNTGSIQKAKELFGYYTQNDELFNLIEWKEVDLNSISEVKEAFTGMDFVLHTAAVVSFDNRHKSRIIESNTRMAANVVDAALETGVTKLCHISSIAALGSTINGDPITEETKYSSVKGQSGYSISKFYSEMEVWRGINLGLNAVILNPSVILGPGDWNNGSAKLVSTVAKGIPFYTQGITGFVDVRDVAKAARVVLESSVSGEQYLLNSENLNFRYLFSSLAKALNSKAPYIKTSLSMLMVAAAVCLTISYITGKEPLITFSSARSAWKKSYYSGEKFSSTFHFTYTPIAETMLFASQCYQTRFKR